MPPRVCCSTRHSQIPCGNSALHEMVPVGRGVHPGSPSRSFMRRRNSRLAVLGSRVHRLLATAAVLSLTIAPRAHAQTFDDPVHFSVVATYALPANVSRPLGGLRFSSNGATLYVVSGVSTGSSKVYAVPITRNAQQHVITLGAGVLQVSASGSPDSEQPDAGIDSGLEIGPTPAGTTLFYTYFPT